jgi:tetratricopeptide (TPR) repeat protein
MMGRLEEARAAYRRALELGPEGEMVVGTGSFINHYQLALIAEAQGDLAGALDAYRACLGMRPDYAPALERCVDIVLRHHHPLPRALWDTADHAALAAAFTHRIRALRRQGDDAGAMLLIEGTRLLDPGLHQACARA